MIYGLNTGLNFRDPDGLLLKRIFAGSKKYETRIYNPNSRTHGALAPAHLNKRIGIIQTGRGKARLVGSWELCRPQLMPGSDIIRDKALLAVCGNDNTNYEIQPDKSYWLYEIKDPRRVSPVEISTRGIVSRTLISEDLQK